MTMELIPDGPQARLRLAVAVAAATVASVGMWAIVVVLPAVQAEFGIGRGQVSYAYTAIMSGFALGNLLISRAVDRMGIAPLLAAAGLTIGVCYGLSTVARSFTEFLALQFIIGIATATGFGPLIADISHWFRKRRGIAVAIVASGNYLAGAVWPLLLKPVVETGGWRPAFMIIAFAGVLILPALSLAMRQRIAVEGPSSAATQLASTPFSPTQLQVLLMIAGVSCCVAMSMPQVHIVAYCMDLGYGIGAGAQMLSIMLGSGIVSRLAFGMLSDRIGGVRTLLISSSLQCLSLFLFLPFDGLVSLYMISMFFGLAQGGIVPSYAIIVREYLPAHEAGKRVGIVILATIAGMAFGGWLNGFIYDLTGSYREAILNGIAWNFLNIAVMGVILWRSRPSRAAIA